MKTDTWVNKTESIEVIASYDSKFAKKSKLFIPFGNDQLFILQKYRKQLDELMMNMDIHDRKGLALIMGESQRTVRFINNITKNGI